MPENLNEVQLRVGNAIRTLRLRHDLSLEKLAERSGIATQHLSVIELGKSNVTLETLTRLANEFDVSVSDLVPRPDATVGLVHPFNRPERGVLKRAARLILDRFPEDERD